LTLYFLLKNCITKRNDNMFKQIKIMVNSFLFSFRKFYWIELIMKECQEQNIQRTKKH